MKKTIAVLAGLTMSSVALAEGFPITVGGTVVPDTGGTTGEYTNCSATANGLDALTFTEAVAGEPSADHAVTFTVDLSCDGGGVGASQKFAFGLANYYYDQGQLDGAFGSDARSFSACSGTPWDRCASLPIDISNPVAEGAPITNDPTTQRDALVYVYLEDGDGVCTGSNINNVTCTFTGADGVDGAAATVTFRAQIHDSEGNPTVPASVGSIQPAEFGSPALYVDLVD